MSQIFIIQTHRLFTIFSRRYDLGEYNRWQRRSHIKQKSYSHDIEVVVSEDIEEQDEIVRILSNLDTKIRIKSTNKYDSRGCW